MSQIRSWENSMEYMYKVLNDSEIPADCGVAIEFTIPTTSKRIDFILTGLNQFQDDSVVIINGKGIYVDGNCLTQDSPKGVTVELVSEDDSYLYFDIIGRDAIITSN